jgi:hypothetical protein
MADRADHDWLEALAGRPPADDAQLAAVKEGAIVRQTMLSSQRRAPRFDADSGVRRLLDRLREEKLLTRPGGGRFGWKVPALAGLVALVIAFAVAFREDPRDAPPAAPPVPVMKGSPDTPQAIVTPDAREIADEIRTMMMGAGLPPDVAAAGPITRLEADWPRRPSQQQLEFLRLYDLAQPSGPRLKIEIRVPQD